MSTLWIPGIFPSGVGKEKSLMSSGGRDQIRGLLFSKSYLALYSLAPKRFTEARHNAFAF